MFHRPLHFEFGVSLQLSVVTCCIIRDVTKSSPVLIVLSLGFPLPELKLDLDFSVLDLTHFRLTTLVNT